MQIDIAEMLKLVLRLGNMVDILEDKLREVAQEKTKVENELSELKKLLESKGGES